MNRFILQITVAALAALLSACALQEHSISESASVAREQSTAAAAAVKQASSAAVLSSSKPDRPALTLTVGGETVSLKTGSEPRVFDAASTQDLPVITQPDAQYTVSFGGTEVFSGDAKALAAFTPSENGTYAYVVKIPDKTSFAFEVNCRFPVQITVPTTAKQGETIAIHVQYAQADTLAAQSGLDFTPQFFPDGDGLTALLPVRYTTNPGAYPLTVQAGNAAFHYSIQIEKRDFEVQYLTMDPGTAADTALSAAANAEWEQKIEPLKKICDPQRYWENPFLQPVQGEITTEFGCIRYTNDDPTPTRHSGIDIAAAQGTPVAACNNGRVLFADYLQLTGNTVIIEHGLGLKSFHYHMDSLSVKEGDMVTKGQEIGKVGTTGYSTGPHLHFALAVNNVFVNPWSAMENGI